MSKHLFVDKKALNMAYLKKYNILGSSLATYRYTGGPAYAN